ncbi:helix-turn-helix domain-containing protein [Streptomyces scabiei]|uniref:AraC-like ligand-binding domain-containing protein n=1 Tax=Streptomyces scabiei TaxID=1930 RepID=UPI00069090BF|nr:helix-turn-helix domain-containing protein [Streptomyces scabiei]
MGGRTVLVTRLRTQDLPVAERFASWYDMAARAFAPSVLRSDHEADFRADARVLDLGGVQVSSLAYPSLESRRPASMIRSSDPESLHLLLTLRGGHRILQGGRDITSGPGEAVLYDTSRPWHGWAAAGHDTVQAVMVQFPRALLPLPADQVRRLTGMRLSGREPMGALLSGYLTQLTAGAAAYTVADGARLATVTLDLVTAFLAHHLETGTPAPERAHRDARLLEIRAFVQRHLGDPELSPSMIAAAHNISLRSLHRLFGEEDMTVAGWIRTRRLELCRRDLADPRLHAHPVRAIATRWGFTDPAHFSRAFRTAHGLSPREYRRLHP